MSRVKEFREYWAFRLILLVAIFNGLTFVFLMPPWQHYDEPGHFEYAWLIANKPGQPAPGEYDQGMRREMAASMIEHQFFHRMSFLPNLLSQSEPIWIGVSQTDDQPLYYWLVALPLRVVQTSDITFQLYLARSISWLLYLVTIAASFGFAREITPEGHSLRWMLPLALALLPAFTDIMSAVNNDVGATAFFSLFTWAGIRMIRRGITWQNLAALGVTTLLCFFTKRNSGVALFIFPIPILFGLLINRFNRLAFVLIFLSLIITGFAAVGWGDAAAWMSFGSQSDPTRTNSPVESSGKYAFVLVGQAEGEQPTLSQVLDRDKVIDLKDRTLTLGSWIWADRPAKVLTPVISVDGESYYQEITASHEPTFYSMTAWVTPQANKISVSLDPFLEQAEAGVRVYFDDLMLVEGEFGSTDMLALVNGRGRAVHTGEKNLPNLLRNGSAEQAWPRLRPWTVKVLGQIFPASPQLLIPAFLDWGAWSWYYQESVRNISNTFWAQFGWGHIVLAYGRRFHPYKILFVLSMAGIAGSMVGIVRRRRCISWETVLFLVLAILVVWVPAFFRGIDSLISSPFYPAARYTYPAILPTMLVLVVGWLEWARAAELTLRLPSWFKEAAFLGFFLVLDLVSILSILRYYSL